MELLKVDTIEDAREKLMSKVNFPFIRVEKVSLGDAVGRILAEDVSAVQDIPAFDRSSVDGYAVKAADTHGATESIPAFLDLLEEVEIGYPPAQKVRGGACTYVPTGGMIPQGADAMVMIEYTDLLDASTVAVNTSVPVGASVVHRGEDAKSGDVLLRRGTVLGAAEIGTLAACGIAEVPAVVPLRVWILSTGDELVVPGETLNAGQVYDINTWALSAAAEKMGLTVVGRQHLVDDYDSIRNACAQAMQEADLVLTSGGSSKGKKDMTSMILNELSHPGVFVHGLAVKPGKPTILAVDEPTGTVMVGLPGHPAAALMVFREIIGWFWRELTGQEEEVLFYAPMGENMASAPGRTTCQLVEIVRQEDSICIRPVFGKSGLITPMTRADGYIRISRNSEGIRKGDITAVYPLE